MRPEASIIVIAFNEDRRIGACLEALLSQDAPIAYEILVVDDGSSDGTISTVEELQRHHQNLRLLRHPVNKGRGAARRSGQDATNATWIGFVDADIVVPPNWLRRCLEELTRASGVSGIAQPDGDCAVIWRISRATLRERPGSAEITGNNVLLSREALTQVPFSPTASLGEDFRLAKAMAQHGFKLRTIRDLKVTHRETKTYRKGISWMWESGVDATSLLYEFRVIRLPDVAWFSWFAGTCLVIVLALLHVLSAGLTVALVAAFTVVVDVAFVFSRFLLRPHPARFLGALVISPPLMLAYLLGRSAGLVLAPLRRHHSD